MKEKTNDIAKQSGSMVSSKEVSEREKKERMGTQYQRNYRTVTSKLWGKIFLTLI